MAFPFGPGQAEPVVDPLLGQTLGHYRVLKALGRGGMGTVYLGEHVSIGSKVAIKVLHEHLASSPTLVQRFWSEAKSVNVIGHSNIVNIFDLGQLPPARYYLVMEWLEGRPLAEALGAPVSAEAATSVLVQVCDALEAAHRAGVVHRDIKPDNIFLVRKGRQADFVKVLDFGIAKLRLGDGAMEHTAAGLIIGTPEYMSPEQADGGDIDGRSDIYSLGIIAYQMAVGHVPFQSPSVPALLVAHAREVPRAPSELVAGLPQAWSDAVMHALEKSPAARFQSASAFGAALEAALGPAAHHGPEWPREGPAPAPTGTPRPPARQPTPVSAAALRGSPSGTGRAPWGGSGASQGPAPARPPTPAGPASDGSRGRPTTDAFGRAPTLPPALSAAAVRGEPPPWGTGAAALPDPPRPSAPPGVLPENGASQAPSPPWPDDARRSPSVASFGPSAGSALRVTPMHGTPPAPWPADARHSPSVASFGPSASAGSAVRGTPAHGAPPAPWPEEAARPVAAGGSFAAPSTGSALRGTPAHGAPPAPGAPSNATAIFGHDSSSGRSSAPAPRAPASEPAGPASLDSGLRVAPATAMFGSPSGASRLAPATPRSGVVAAPPSAHQATFTDGAGQRLGRFTCESITRAGLFAVTSGALPPLMSRVRVEASTLGHLACEADVVQHLTALQAREWGRPAGFAVQFVGLTAAQRQALEGALGLPPAAAPTPVRGTPAAPKDDPLVAAVLARFGPRFEKDPYALLGVAPDVAFPDLRARWRDATRELEQLDQRRLSEAQHEALGAARQRLQAAFDAIATPAHRLVHDARAGNYAGVARCIAAGLSVTELDAARAIFLKEHPGAETRGQLERLRARAFENAHATADALAAWEASLRHDPLCLEAQKRYLALRASP